MRPEIVNYLRNVFIFGFKSCEEKKDEFALNFTTWCQRNQIEFTKDDMCIFNGDEMSQKNLIKLYKELIKIKGKLEDLKTEQTILTHGKS